MSREQRPMFYQMSKQVVPDHDGSAFHTAAVMSCCRCGVAISGMGGPGVGAFCLPCGEDVIRQRVQQ